MSGAVVTAACQTPDSKGAQEIPWHSVLSSKKLHDFHLESWNESYPNLFQKKLQVKYNPSIYQSNNESMSDLSTISDVFFPMIFLLFQYFGDISADRYGKSTIWRCISYWKWWFSISMLVYQRVGDTTFSPVKTAAEAAGLGGKASPEDQSDSLTPSELTWSTRPIPTPKPVVDRMDGPKRSGKTVIQNDFKGYMGPSYVGIISYVAIMKSPLWKFSTWKPEIIRLKGKNHLKHPLSLLGSSS